MRSNEQRRYALAWVIGVSMLVIVIFALIQLTAGSFGMTWQRAFAAIFDPQVWKSPTTLGHFLLGDAGASAVGLESTRALTTETLIVWNVRLPRVLVAVFVGINLSVSGSILQAVTRNEMASPFLLGVSSGAGLAVILILVLFPMLAPLLPVMAMLGGGLAFLIVYAIAWNRGTSPVRLVLAGVVVAAIAGSIQTGLFLMAKEISVVQNALAWTTGSLTGVGWQQVRQIAPWTLVSSMIALLTTRQLDVLQLGDPAARSLGMRVEWVRFWLSANAIIAAGSAVAVAGLIGFVGLIVPHVVRNLVGGTHRRLLIGCLFSGPALLVCADAGARLLVQPMQLPVGIITGCLGGGFFLYIMRRRPEIGKL
ncbi:iron ABC transporter permease [Luteolibacter pohnpeiensis]|uniref:Iron ABC transporter permease n=1 Tax=Luteolibacter pohnpeiensis TaxID=454153 RepID=A0A934VWR8_9BACT|nr:iron ABC transporter permease [Luteolibacter pohnpeiensis]MBK1883088.1 iron ABC transporter permease [Luteolibacter pohnpeiensis]